MMMQNRLMLERGESSRLACYYMYELVLKIDVIPRGGAERPRGRGAAGADATYRVGPDLKSKILPCLPCDHLTCDDAAAVINSYRTRTK